MASAPDHPMLTIQRTWSLFCLCEVCQNMYRIASCGLFLLAARGNYSFIPIAIQRSFDPDTARLIVSAHTCPVSAKNHLRMRKRTGASIAKCCFFHDSNKMGKRSHSDTVLLHFPAGEITLVFKAIGILCHSDGSLLYLSQSLTSRMACRFCFGDGTTV